MPTYIHTYISATHITLACNSRSSGRGTLDAGRWTQALSGGRLSLAEAPADSRSGAANSPAAREQEQEEQEDDEGTKKCQPSAEQRQGRGRTLSPDATGGAGSRAPRRSLDAGGGACLIWQAVRTKRPPNY